MTITNDGAPSDEWRFGKLEPKGKGYKVKSPIAVKGALFDAPTEVPRVALAAPSASMCSLGTDGSYAAVSHGLVPTVQKAGDIGRDPDSAYPSGDDAPGPAGGVDKYPITLTDTAIFRVELAIPGDDDTDLFLGDSSGTIIAASANGGIDELIELV